MSTTITLNIKNQTHRPLHLKSISSDSGHDAHGNSDYVTAPPIVYPGQTITIDTTSSLFRGVDFTVEYSYDSNNSVQLYYDVPYTGDNDSGHKVTGSLLKTDFAKLPKRGSNFNRTVTIWDGEIEKINTASWMFDMQDLLWELKVCDALIPGSHDSATYQLENWIAPGQDVPAWLNYSAAGGKLPNGITSGIIRDWAQAQSKTLYDQLKAGVRFLDLRVIRGNPNIEVAPIPGPGGTIGKITPDMKFYACHSLYGLDYDTLLRDIERFTEENPEEILILDVEHLDRFVTTDKSEGFSKKDHRDLIALFKKYLGNYLVRRSADDDPKHFARTFGELWEEMEGKADKDKQRIILLYKDDATVANDLALWGDDIPTVYGNKQKVDDLITYLNDNISKIHQDNRVMTTQLQLTAPSGVTDLIGWIASSKLYGNPENLLELADKTNSTMRGWLLNYSDKAKCNVILADNVNADLSTFIVEQNQFLQALPIYRVPKVYVAVSGDNQVVAIHGKDNSIAAKIPVGQLPVDLAFSNDGMNAYVVNQTDKTISIIDTSKNEVIGTIKNIGNNARGLVVAPDDSLLVANCTGAGAVVIIDPDKPGEVTKIPVDPQPWTIAVTPDGKKAYVSSFSTTSKINIINLDSKKVTGSIKVGKDPRGMLISNDGKTLYVASYQEGTVYAIDTSQDKVTSTIKVSSPFSLAISSDDSQLYVGRIDDNRVSVIKNNEVIAEIKTGSRPWGVDVSPDDTLLYVINCDDGTVSVIDTDGYQVLETVNVGTQPNAVGRFVWEPQDFYKMEVSPSSMKATYSGYAPKGDWVVSGYLTGDGGASFLPSIWNNDDHLKWAFDDLGNGQFRIIHKATGRVLEAVNESGDNMPFLNEANDSDYQKWSFVSQGATEEGYLQIVSVHYPDQALGIPIPTPVPRIAMDVARDKTLLVRFTRVD